MPDSLSPSCVVRVIEHLNLDEKAKLLGVNVPKGVSILPRHFLDSDDASKLVFEDSAQDVKVVLKRAGITLDNIVPKERVIPIQAQHDAQWIGPTLFVGALALSQNPNLISIALGVIANFVTDLFRGKLGTHNMTLDIAVEQKEKTEKKGDIEVSETTNCVLCHYSGPPESFVATVTQTIRDALKKV